MTAPVSRDHAEHYVWGDGCDGWHLLRGEALSVIEERMPAGTKEQRHFHKRSQQFFYVLEGELTMELAGVLYRLAAGRGLEIAPGESHQAMNQSEGDVRFLVVSQPPSQGDRVPAPPRD
jgi:quercetin dioxygenase-like cupin family protein